MGENTLDIIGTNRPSLVKSCKPVSGISNLEAVVIYCSFKIDLQPDISQIFITSYTIYTPVNDLWNKFKDFCLSILNSIASHFTSNQSTTG